MQEQLPRKPSIERYMDVLERVLAGTNRASVPIRADTIKEASTITH